MQKPVFSRRGSFKPVSIVSTCNFFVCVDAQLPSQIFFSHVGMEPPLSGYYQYFSRSKCVFAQGHNTVEVGIEPMTSRSRVRDSTTMQPCSPNTCNCEGCFALPSLHMSLVVRKLVFGVSDQVRHKPGCTATEDG